MYSSTVGEGKYDSVLEQPSSQSHPYYHCCLLSSCLRKSSAKSGIAASQTAQLKSVRIRTGLGLGIVFSVVFFKRRTSPIAFGTGLGLGMAYSNCQNDLRSHYVLHSNVAKEP
ncbi:hypothetical protein ABG768_016661 [Culter alburnus]|uniref:MICOS complex subunit MIC10 n=1 Tax=Culter alburnus TaxID=194366 RepID=A0AAW1Z3D3_CULAL